MSINIRKTENGLFGLVSKNTKGETIQVCPPVYEDARELSNGLAAVKMCGKWGFINEKGQVTIPFKFDTINDFHFDYTFLKCSKTDKYSIINKKGIQICEYEYDEIHIQGNELFFARKGNLFCLLNKTGKKVSDFKYEGIGCMNSEDKLIPVFSNKKWGFVNLEGNEVIECKFNDLGNFSEGLAPACLEKKWGYINKKGDFLIKPIYEFALDFRHQVASVKEDGKFGYISKKGYTPNYGMYNFAGPFSEKYSQYFIDNLRKNKTADKLTKKKEFNLYKVKKIIKNFTEDYNARIILKEEDIPKIMALVSVINESTNGFRIPQYGFIDLNKNEYIFSDFFFKRVFVPKRFIYKFVPKTKKFALTQIHPFN